MEYEKNCSPFEIFVAAVVPLVGVAGVTTPIASFVVGKGNFVVTRVCSVCVSDVGDVIVVLSVPEDDIIFVVTREVVASVV